MSLITEAYFREGDFSRLDLIHQTYDNLNACLTDDMLHTQQLYVGLSARHLVRTFRQRALVLFKLLLLERKVLFYQSPVKDLCGFLLTLLSLHPGMLERGLDEAARMVPVDTPPACASPTKEEPAREALEDVEDQEEDEEKEEKEGEKAKPLDAKEPKEEPEVEEATEATESKEVGKESDEAEGNGDQPKSEMTSSNSIVGIASEKVGDLKGKLSGAFGYITGIKSPTSETAPGLGEEKEDGEDKKSVKSHDSAGSEEGGNGPQAIPSFSSIATTPISSLGLPLRVFTGGNLCHPYLSLSYLDALSQPCVRGYLVGATNVLFKQKRGFAEVLVDPERDGHVEVTDPELRRALQPTTEDLRFVDNVVKKVSGDESSEGGSPPDVFLDSVGWEGGDEWVRAQFRFYLVCLLRTSLLDEEASSSSADSGGEPSPHSSLEESGGGGRMDHLFNASFMRAWRRTNNYRRWRRELEADAAAKAALKDLLPPGHPFAGMISVSDVRLHLSNTIGASEGGKKVSQVLSNTGRSVAGGLSTAKGAVSSFFSSLRQPQKEEEEEPEQSQEAKEEETPETKATEAPAPETKKVDA